MLKIEYYEDECRKLDGRYSCCAYINTDDFDGYTTLDTIESRCKTYEDAKNELLNHIVKLRDALNYLIEKETKI